MIETIFYLIIIGSMMHGERLQFILEDLYQVLASGRLEFYMIIGSRNPLE